MNDHLQHLYEVLTLLKENSLKINKKKCSFAQAKLKYLGHLISRDGVQANPTKIQAMTNWPIPTSVKELRSFLGLIGYYRRFVEGYGKIATPLTTLLWKDNFIWTREATKAENCNVNDASIGFARFLDSFCHRNECFWRWHWVVLMQR